MAIAGTAVTTSLAGCSRRIVDVDYIVQSAEIRLEDGNRTYTLKLDHLGGLYARIGLPVNEEIPEEEYRDVLVTHEARS